MRFFSDWLHKAFALVVVLCGWHFSVPKAVALPKVCRWLAAAVFIQICFKVELTCMFLLSNTASILQPMNKAMPQAVKYFYQKKNLFRKLFKNKILVL